MCDLPHASFTLYRITTYHTFKNTVHNTKNRNSTYRGQTHSHPVTHMRPATMRFPGGIEPDPSRTHSGSGRMPKISLTPEGGQLLERPGLRTATWIYEVSYRQKRRLQAIKIVLQFRAEVHKRREERTASIMNRVASLPSELLLEVVEACVESQVGCWNVQD